jgi:hypothetical protein
MAYGDIGAGVNTFRLPPFHPIARPKAEIALISVSSAYWYVLVLATLYGDSR